MKNSFNYHSTKLLMVFIMIAGLSSCIDESQPYLAPTSEIVSIDIINNQLVATVEIQNLGSEKNPEIGIITAKNIDPAYYVNTGDQFTFYPISKKGINQIPLEVYDIGYYYFRTIIKTQSSQWYYSPINEFVFDGSNIIDNSDIIFPEDHLYFGEVVTISNESFGIDPTNYYVEINGFPGKIINASKNSFQFIFPDSLNFQYGQLNNYVDSQGQAGDFISISYKTSNGMVEKVKKLPFTSPHFLSFQNIKKDLTPGLNWIIEGEFLSDKFLEVRVLNSESLLKIVSITDSRIEVEPGEGINFENPTLEITCRGRRYGVNFPTISEEDPIDCDSCPVGG